MPSLHNEWLNRPAHLMYLGFDEYVAQKEEHNPVPQPVIPAEMRKTVGRPRHEAGVMNGMEKKYAAYLELRRIAGEILEWRFEPLKLRLAPKTYYTPDFLLLMPDGRIELHETKGFMEEDANVKIKVAREMFSSIFTIVLVRLDKNKNWTLK